MEQREAQLQNEVEQLKSDMSKVSNSFTSLLCTPPKIIVTCLVI